MKTKRSSKKLFLRKSRHIQDFPTKTAIGKIYRTSGLEGEVDNMNLLGIGAVFLDDEHCIVGYIDEKEEWIAVRGLPCMENIHEMTVSDVIVAMNKVKKKSFVYVLPKKYPILLAKGAMYFRKQIPEK